MFLNYKGMPSNISMAPSRLCDDHVTKSFGVEACFAVGEIEPREHRQKLEHSAGPRI